MRTIKKYIFLHLVLVLFALSGVFSKLASSEEPLSFKFFLFYGIVLMILFVYALLWQQVIKNIPIVTAYANKAVTIIWGLVFGFFVFGETITPGKILGAVVIIIGVYFVVTADLETEDKA